ncbi:MAG: iron ABC transporter permease [Verrucomicrobiota bacterium]|nr:iron ABC transporter permease [Verrucomicrobiota bacterium]
MSQREVPAHEYQPKGFVLCVLGILVVGAAIVSAGIGTVSIPPIDVVKAIVSKITGQMLVDDVTLNIVWNLRLPRLLLAVFSGACLAMAGLIMQALFHNPMADPYVVGASSGASSGAILALWLNVYGQWWGIGLAAIFAFAGSLGVTLLVYFLSARQGRVQMTTLLLTGLAIGGFMQAVSTLLLLQLESFELRGMLSWLMGSFANKRWEHVMILVPYSIVGLTAAFYWKGELNILSMGDEAAHHLGVNVERTKFALLVIATLLTAASVAVSGTIGFVGLIVPHLMRMVVGPNHRVLVPSSILCGGFVLLVADILARKVLPGSEIPIGIVTSIVGCLFFLYLLQRASKKEQV